MAAVLSNTNVEEEYMWSCSLDNDNKEFEWMPEATAKGLESNNEDEKDDPKPGHRLLIKNAILMPQAEKDVVNIVQIECNGCNNMKVITPMVVMKGQVDYQRYVDLLVPCPAKIKLVSGNGPIHLTGSHCVDFYGYRGQEERDVEESEEDVEMEGDGDKKEDLRNKLNKKGSKKNEAKIIETKSKSEKVDNVKEGKKDEENESAAGSKKRKASEDLKLEDDKKTKTGSVEKKEKRKSK